MPRPVSPAMKRAVLAVAGALMLFSWPDSRATTAAASERQGLGSAVPRDPQPRTVRRRTETRARALLDARQRGLDYVPGEVIVKFRDGIASLTRQRALSALRSRPSVNDLEWHGDVALLTDVTEPDAHLLAHQLRQQREVEYAEPNYLIRIKPVGERVRLDMAADAEPAATPNDPFYTSHQWNFSGLNMPRAWDINAGATSDIVVAVVDTGVTTVNQTFNFAYWNGSAIQTIAMPFSISPGIPVSRLTRPRDFVFGQTVLDLEGHGTHVAATVAETTNDMMRTAGIAYNAQIMPVKVCTASGTSRLTGHLAAGPVASLMTRAAAARSTSPMASNTRRIRAPRSSTSASAGPNPSNALREAIELRGAAGRFRRDRDGQRLRGRQSDHLSGQIRRAL